jgi:hypothetical protein
MRFAPAGISPTFDNDTTVLAGFERLERMANYAHRYLCSRRGIRGGAELGMTAILLWATVALHAALAIWCLSCLRSVFHKVEALVNVEAPVSPPKR